MYDDFFCSLLKKKEIYQGHGKKDMARSHSYLPESGDVLFLDESLLVEYDAAILKTLSSVALERCVHSG